MEAGNGVKSELVNVVLEESPELDGLFSNINKENGNTDNGIGTLPVNVIFEHYDSSEVGDESCSDVSRDIVPNLSKKIGSDQGDGVKNSKTPKDLGVRNSAAALRRNQRPGLSQSLSFPSKGILNSGLRKNTTLVKQTKTGVENSCSNGMEVASSVTNGGLPAKQTKLAAASNTRRSLSVKSGSMDAASNGTSSEALKSTVSHATVQRKSIASGFASRLNERAEKRKEVEEKIQTKEVEKTNLQEKSKENQEAEIKQLRKSLTFKATPMPSFYQEPSPPMLELKKIPPTRARSPKLGRHKSLVAGADNSSEGIISCRSSQPSLNPSKLNGGASNNSTSSISSKKMMSKSLSKLQSHKSTAAKPEATPLGSKPKVSNPGPKIEKANIDIEENQNKPTENCPFETGASVEAESTKNTVEDDETIISLPNPDVASEVYIAV